MPNQHVIVIGASAGGVEALIRLVRALPAGLPASLFVVVHFPIDSVSFLPSILNRHGSLPARHLEASEVIQPGCIYVAPPGTHMILGEGEKVHLVQGPRINGFRPAIDPLFHSAASHFGPRAVGVILSGTLGDGAAGLQALKHAGGVAIVQDPQEAVFPMLPNYAIEKAPVDRILPISGIAQALQELAARPVSAQGETRMNEAQEERIVADSLAGFEQGKPSGANSVLTCPECGGVLWELRSGELIHYRCHVGHVYSSESLFAEQALALEAALWTAIRTLEERASLGRRLGVQARERSSPNVTQRFLNQADEMERKANVIRALVLNQKTGEEPTLPPQSLPGSGT